MLFEEFTEGRNAAPFSVGDPVIITGNVEFRGKTGDVRQVGQNGAFVVVDLYNYGPHSFHAADVGLNDYADSDDEAEYQQGVAEGSGYDGSEPLDLSTDPSVNDVFKRALYIYDYEGYSNDMDYSEDDAIDQYVASKFGQDVLDQLNKARYQSYFGRADDRGLGGYRGDNLGRASAPGGNFRTTKAGKMHGQDAKIMKARVSDRLGRHPEPNLPEQSVAETDQVGNMPADKFDDAMARLKQLAGAGPLKTVWDPQKRVYKNVPTAVQPKK